MPDLVKIGKTQRDPQDRVAELSSGTGIPTPFFLAYKELFADCSEAEKFVHTYLSQKNYRVSENREFFKVPLSVAIEAIQSAKRTLLKQAADDAVDKTSEKKANPIERPYDEAIIQAVNYYLGRNGALQDYEEALRYFKIAIELGCDEVYSHVGDMYRYGYGCKADINTAKYYYRKGSERGDIRCWVILAEIYIRYEDHLQNWNICWDNAFNLMVKANIEGDDKIESVLIKNGVAYVDQILQFGMENGSLKEGIALSHFRALSPFKDRILAVYDKRYKDVNGSLEYLVSAGKNADIKSALQKQQMERVMIINLLNYKDF